MFYQINTGVAQGGISSNTSCSSGSPSGCRRLFSLLSRNICRGGGSGHPVLCSFHIFFAGKPSDRLRCVQSPALLPPPFAGRVPPAPHPALRQPCCCPPRCLPECAPCAAAQDAALHTLPQLAAWRSWDLAPPRPRGTGWHVARGRRCALVASRRIEKARELPASLLRAAGGLAEPGSEGTGPLWPGAGVSLSGRRERWL